MSDRGLEDTTQSGSEPLSGDEPTTVESLCVNCEQNGVTKMLLVDIPFFRKIILMAFECPHCNFRNSEVQSASEVQSKGVQFTLRVQRKEDFDRQIVKSDTASIRIPELELEIPAQTQRGVLTTVEGVLQRMADNLEEGQIIRRRMDPDGAAAVDQFIERVRLLLQRNTPFTFVLDDPAGNSFVQNPEAPRDDPFMTVTHYERTQAQCEAIGIVYEPPAEERIAEAAAAAAAVPDSQGEDGSAPHGHFKDEVVVSMFRHRPGHKARPPPPSVVRPGGARLTVGCAMQHEPGRTLVKDEAFYKRFLTDVSQVMEFPTSCVMCAHPGVTKMVVCDIPHFKETVVMAFTCDECGYRNNEVKAGGPVSPVGRRCVLRVQCAADMTRDVLKSDTASVYVPEIDLHLTEGTLGGRFTTVEGLLKTVYDNLAENNPFVLGDSADSESRTKYRAFVDALKQLLDAQGARPFTLELDDPLANSYIQSLAEDRFDDQLHVEEYTRTREQDEDLGLLDMRTEDYEPATQPPK